MNILLSPIAYLPMKSGVPILTQRLASAFVKKGHQVVIVTPKLERAHPSFEMIDGIEVHRMPFVLAWNSLFQRPQDGFLQFCRHAPIDINRLVRLAGEKQFDVINIHSLIGPHLPYLLLAQAVAPRPLVVSLHGNEFFRLDAGRRGVRRWLLRAALRRAARITAVSAHLAGEAARFCPEATDKMVTIPNGVAVEEFRGAAGFAFPAPYLLSLARLNPLKGHDVLLTAFREVAARAPDVHLLIAGDGPQRVRLHAITLALGLQERVTFLGDVGREQVKALLAGCECLVLASWNEGMPTVVLEAMAAGKAVIGTRVGGVPEVVADGETGRLVPPGDARALAEAMGALLRDREQRNAMGEKGRAVVEAQHDFTHTVERYLAVYHQAIRQGAGRPEPGTRREGP